MSSGMPEKPSGVARVEAARAASMRSGMPGSSAGGVSPSFAILAQSGVSMPPGWIEFTRTPFFACAHSSATALVKSRTPPLVAQ